MIGSSKTKALYGSGMILLLLSVLQGCVSLPPREYPGKLLNKKVVHIEHAHRYRVKLLPAAGATPRLQFVSYDLRTIHEVPRYEKVLVYANENETDRSRIRTEVIAGEVIEGDVELRRDEVETGPLAGHRVLINGCQAELDDDGVFVDREESILRLFDDLRLKRIVLALEHPAFGATSFSLSRDTLQRALGIAVDPQRTTKPTELVFAADPAVVETLPGETAVLRIHATNQGEALISSVTGRLISRHAWLDGINFYYGNIEPGQPKEFSRRIQIPASLAPGKYFAELGTWEVRGPNAERNILIEVRVGQPVVP